MHLKMILFGALAVTYWAGLGAVRAEGQCAEVLQFGIWDTRDTSDYTFNSQQVANWACSASSRSGGGGFSYGLIGLNLSASSTSNSCSKGQNSYALSNDAREAIKTASRAIVDAWEGCIHSFGSHASVLYRDDLHQFTIILDTRGVLNNRGVAKINSLSKFRCTTPRSKMANGVT